MKKIQAELLAKIQKKLKLAITFDADEASLLLLNLKKEIIVKEASYDEQGYQFYFSNELIKDMDVKLKAGHFQILIALMCEGEDTPLMLNGDEFFSLLGTKRKLGFNIRVEVDKRTFRVSGSSRKLEIAKKTCMNKIINARGNK